MIRKPYTNGLVKSKLEILVVGQLREKVVIPEELEQKFQTAEPQKSEISSKQIILFLRDRKFHATK